MNVLLISPNADSELSEMTEPAHGLAYVAACLLDQKHDVRVIDAKTLHLKTSKVVEMALVLEERPDVIGITAMTPDIIWAGKIADGIKAHRPEIPIIVGGPHPTALPEETLREFPSFDIAVIGEGEMTAVDLLNALQSENATDRIQYIKGIAYRNGDQIVTTEPRPLIEDLDGLPMPAWHLFPARSDHPIFATRGCPFTCKFCMRMMGRRVRKRSPENVILEIERLISDQHGSKSFWFSDETFGVDRLWTEEFLGLMIQRGLSQHVEWFANSRVNIADKELYQKMRQAGCKRLAFGIESGNQKILDNVAKNFKLPDAENAVRLAKESGMVVNAFFILGHPFESRSTLVDTIRFAIRLNPDCISIGIMVPYPGTEIWDMALRNEGGYNFVSRNWDDFRKYHGRPLGLAKIGATELEMWQLAAYFAFYLFNRRFRDLFSLMREHRRSAMASIRRRLSLLVDRAAAF
jgi:anaerobic magnesium-protoporphyrin IX monomethyl ester cyclase